MNRRGLRDVAVVGGGVVGAACGLALSRAGLDVVLVEANAPQPWASDRPDLRVYAIAPDSSGLFDSLGVWASIRDARAWPYRRMEVWDAAAGDPLVFDADVLAQPQLGWIIEHGLIADRLWSALQGEVELRCPARVAECEQDDGQVRLRLDDGGRIDARIAIAADGAASTLRSLAGIEVDAHDYGQKGVVAYVETERSHGDTAWQRFLPGGPLALLPVSERRCSIVWTLPDHEAERVLALDDDAFSRELTDAFEARLGALRVTSARVAFPLRRQLAATQQAGRVLVVGDAAHAVHPLAGQGVNLGLRDVVDLRDAIAEALRRRTQWDAAHRLARWARARRSDNTFAAYTFGGINRLFSNDAPMQTLLRGHLLGLAGRLPPVVSALWRRAS